MNLCISIIFLLIKLICPFDSGINTTNQNNNNINQLISNMLHMYPKFGRDNARDVLGEPVYRAPKMYASPKVSTSCMECLVEAKPITSKVLNGWFIDVNMRLYFVDPMNRDRIIRTTPVSYINGNTVTTISGSAYVLGTIDPLVRKRVAHVDISSSNPLSEETIHYIVNAATDMYSDILLMFPKSGLK